MQGRVSSVVPHACIFRAIPRLEKEIEEGFVVRALAGAIAAGGISAAARKSRALSESGQWAAFFCGVAAAAAGWWWAAVLIAFFVSSSWLTHWRAPEKAALTIGALPRAQERNATQVLANGGLFVLLALLYHHERRDWIAFAALGAIAAASSDTWSTEIGTLFGGAPRMITSGQQVEPGLSGGVSMIGFAGGLAGAVFIALIGAFALPARYLPLAIATAIGGAAGGLGDSLIGATLQSKRLCDQCRRWTEQRVHSCGYRTRHARGIDWMSNDAVNFAGTCIGAAAAVLSAWAFR